MPPGRREIEKFWDERGRAAALSEADAVCCTGAPDFLNRYVDRSQRLAVDRLLRTIGPLSGLRAVDVGCGTGRWCRLLAARGANVVGVDRSSEMLDEARRRAPRIEFRQADATLLPFDNDAFDVATTVTVIQHLPHEDQPAAIAELVRVVRAGGWIVAVDTDRKPNEFAARNGSFPRPRDEWVRLWMAAGADAVVVRGQEFSYPLRLVDLLRRADGSPVADSSGIPATRRAARGWRREVLRMLVGASYVTEIVAATCVPHAPAEHVAVLYRVRG